MDPLSYHPKGFCVLTTATTEPSMNLPKQSDWIFRYNGSYFNFVQQLAKIAYEHKFAPRQRIFRFEDPNYGAFDESY